MADQVDALEGRMAAMEDSVRKTMEEFQNSILAEIKKIIVRPTPGSVSGTTVAEKVATE